MVNVRYWGKGDTVSDVALILWSGVRDDVPVSAFKQAIRERFRDRPSIDHP